jgi:anhydro-N-acetylmuramic acid kinase
MRCIGVLSGTSMNAKEFILCEIKGEGKIEVLKYKSYPLENELKSELKNISINGSGMIEEIAEIHYKLGMSFADSLKKFIKGERKLDVIGFHGQTIFHKEEGKITLTWQIGEPVFLSKVSGLPVVYDFRKCDIAMGGRGAPLSPIIHRILFGKVSKKVAVVNLGGIANITLIKDGEVVSARDVGPANALSDYIIQKRLGLEYDKDGKMAEKGKVIEYAFKNAVKFFSSIKSKSLGYEVEIAKKNFEEMTKRARIEDCLRTAIEISVVLLARSLKDFKPDVVILCGGGARNKFMVKRITEESKNVFISDEFGVKAEFVEPILFAFLAYMRMKEKKIDMKKLTGAKKPYLPGKICRVV